MGFPPPACSAGAGKTALRLIDRTSEHESHSGLPLYLWRSLLTVKQDLFSLAWGQF
jgi:hypothetical protein